MNKRLANADYLGGEDYSIADIASLPWVRMAVIHPATAELDLAQHPQLHDWWKRVSARPAVTRGLAVPEPFPPEEQFKAFVSATVGLE
ncbi:MAG: glutathione binding-like protein [Myxococcota bacterium]